MKNKYLIGLLIITNLITVGVVVMLVGGKHGSSPSSLESLPIQTLSLSESQPAAPFKAEPEDKFYCLKWYVKNKNIKIS